MAKGDERADGHRQAGQACFDSEHAGEQVLGHESGGQCVQAGVHERVPEADHAHQAQDDGCVREAPLTMRGTPKHMTPRP